MFRRPAYPLIANINGFLICGKSEVEFYKQFKRASVDCAQNYAVLASNTDKWTLLAKDMTITPGFTIGQRWTKLELIELFNASANARFLAAEYSTKSLSSKKAPRVFNDILQLVEASLNEPDEA